MIIHEVNIIGYVSYGNNQIECKIYSAFYMRIFNSSIYRSSCMKMTLSLFYDQIAFLKMI